MNETGGYSAFRIPRREDAEGDKKSILLRAVQNAQAAQRNWPYKTTAPHTPEPQARHSHEAPPQRVYETHLNELSLSDIGFAEIEYEFAANEKRLGASDQPVPINRRPDVDPIREKIYNMRSLSTGNPFGRNDAALFYKQAKFMEGFEDDYRAKADLYMYYPFYQQMGYAQLRTYFSWRARVRRGEIAETSFSYVFLYIYELLAGVGVGDAAEGLEKLTSLWGEYRKYKPELDRYMSRWIRDYHIYYELPHDFSVYVKTHELQEYYPELYLFDEAEVNKFALWNAISGYDAAKSGFYNAGNAEALKKCFDYVLRSIRELCSQHDKQAGDLLLVDKFTTIYWTPFRGALFYEDKRQPDRSVTMQNGETYCRKDGVWTTNAAINDSARKELAGYLIKKTEAGLRKAVKYKYKLNVNPGMLAVDLKKLGITIKMFDAAIEKAVAHFQSDARRTVVTVDRDNLARIRVEALGTQNRLIVPEDGYLQPHMGDGETQAAPAAATANAPVSEQSEDDGWIAFGEALSAPERDALALILRGGADFLKYAREKGFMPEILIDGINEKAADYAGDNILDADGLYGDGVVSIYGDYMEPVADMISNRSGAAANER